MYPPRPRPIGITLLAIPFLWIGCFGTLIFPLMIPFVGRSLWETLTPTLSSSKDFALAATVLLLTLGMAAYILYAFLGYGLWKLRPWALKATVIVNTLCLVLSAILVLALLKSQPLMAIPFAVGLLIPYAGILWYLKRPNVRAAFGFPIPTPPISVATPRKPRKTWVIATIALSACAILLATFVASLFYVIDQSFRRSAVYSMSLERARNSPCVVAKLGKPIVVKGMIEGNLDTQGSLGTANLQIPVNGPNASGSLDVSGKKIDGVWNITSLTLLDSDGQIHLLPTPSCP